MNLAPPNRCIHCDQALDRREWICEQCQAPACSQRCLREHLRTVAAPSSPPEEEK
jgi:predicted amidophosphoribosyltransferase